MESRIQKSFRNAQVNVIFYILTTILAFFSRKIFIDNLGTEFLGLSGTLGNILSLMNITELGIGTAIGVSLYKPLFDKDHDTINDIISVFGYLYSIIGAIIASAGIIISLFFPLIFANIEIPLYLPYLMFFSMLYSALLGYFVNFRQILLSASQHNYVVMLRYNTMTIIKILLQMATSSLPFNYIWYIALEAITTTVYAVVLNKTIKHYFPWLDATIKKGKEKFIEYKYLWTKTKQVFVLKLSHVIFNNSTNILIYSFANLTTVTLYGNYEMLMTKITSFVDGLFTGMEASIGNLIAEGDIKKIKKVFNELLCIRYFLAGLCSITLYFTVSPFINVWLGSKYLMPNVLIILLSTHIFVQQARLTVDNFKNGYSLYQDVWAPIIEVVLNLCIGIALAFHYGLMGILLGLVSAEVLVKMFWKPYYLFSHGFKQSVITHYWPLVLKYFLIFAITFVSVFYLKLVYMSFLNTLGWIGMLIYCILIGCSVLSILVILFSISDRNFKTFFNHIMSYIRK